MKRPLKWTIKVDDKFHPVGSGKVLLVESQYGIADEIQVWTEEEEGNTPAISAIVIGTGMEVPKGFEHIGSTTVATGRLVWHVYREKMAGYDAQIVEANLSAIMKELDYEVGND